VAGVIGWVPAPPLDAVDLGCGDFFIGSAADRARRPRATWCRPDRAQPRYQTDFRVLDLTADEHGGFVMIPGAPTPVERGDPRGCAATRA
jgi:hypothetical protein